MYITIPLAELGNLKHIKGGELGLDILLQTYEGSRFRWRIPFNLSNQPAGTPIETGKPAFMRGY